MIMRKTPLLAIVLGLLVAPMAQIASADEVPTLQDRTERLVGMAAELAADQPVTYAATATFQAAAIGDCGKAAVVDGDEGGIIDISVANAQADCDGLIGLGVLTHDLWFAEELYGFVEFLDTDGNPSTGCTGDDYGVSAVYSGGGSFSASVFRTPNCTDTILAGPAIVSTPAAPDDFIAVFFPRSLIGSPASFSYRAATLSIYDTADFAPNSSQPNAVFTFTGGGTPPPPPPPPPVVRPNAVARSTDTSCPPGVIVDAGFTDIDAANPHRFAIDCIVQWGVAEGIGATAYGPTRNVTRAQMASFVARLIENIGGSLPAEAPDAFDDDSGSPHEANINKLAAVGVVTGAGPRQYAPLDNVNRAQMATFIVRAIVHVSDTPMPAPTGDYFGDDDASAHEDNINRAAESGITTGVAPPSYGTRGLVRRDQMASFLARALDYLIDYTQVPVPVPVPEEPPTV